MSATSCFWIFQTPTISGRMVSQPSGPGGSAIAPAASAALAAAAFAFWRASLAGALLGRSFDEGSLPISDRIA